MLSKRLSQIFLTGPGGVAVGRIEKGDAQIQCVRNDRVSPFLISVQSCMVPGLPKLMHPTQIFDMLMPVSPSCVYCI